MKLLHVCLGCFYIDNYSYQENLLPKYHKRLGYDVEILASTLSFDSNGKACNIKSGSYINENGIPVTRLMYNHFVPLKIAKFLRLYDDVDYYLKKASPDIIFIHGCQFYDIKKIKNYAIEHSVTIYVDNHADFSNSARNFFSKNILHKILWRHCAKIIEPYTSMFYGVLPARVDFLNHIYKIPKNKTKLLVMGADDDFVNKYNSYNEINKLKRKNKIDKDDFVIVTGGKIDIAKTQILSLMKVVNEMSCKISLIVFGSVANELKDKFNGLLSDKVKYVGWISSNETYKYIAIADLVVFPGRHSVLWEQTVAQGKPMLIKYWDGTNHVDIGGNVKYLFEDSEQELKKILGELVNNDNNIYKKMNKSAKSIKKNNFLYSEIAKNSLICNTDKKGYSK